MKKLKYLKDTNLADNEFRTMILLDMLIDDREYISETNQQIGKMIGKSGTATAKILCSCAKKGYVKSVNHTIKRKLYILK